MLFYKADKLPQCITHGPFESRDTLFLTYVLQKHRCKCTKRARGGSRKEMNVKSRAEASLFRHLRFFWTCVTKRAARVSCGPIRSPRVTRCSSLPFSPVFKPFLSRAFAIFDGPRLALETAEWDFTASSLKIVIEHKLGLSI